MIMNLISLLPPGLFLPPLTCRMGFRRIDIPRHDRRWEQRYFRLFYAGFRSTKALYERSASVVYQSTASQKACSGARNQRGVAGEPPSVKPAMAAYTFAGKSATRSAA